MHHELTPHKFPVGRRGHAEEKGVYCKRVYGSGRTRNVVCDYVCPFPKNSSHMKRGSAAFGWKSNSLVNVYRIGQHTMHIQ